MKLKLVTISLGVLVLSLLVQGLPEGAEKKPIRLAYLQNDIHHLACWVALEKGFYSQEGLEVNVAGIFKAGPELMTAFSAGALDMAYVGEAPATTAVANKTAKVVVLAQVNTEGSVLVVRKEPRWQSLADMAGRTLAVPGHGTVQDLLLRKALLQAKLDPKQVTILVLKPPEMIGALRSGDIDGFIAWEPFPARALTLEAGKILTHSREIWKDHPCCVLVADTRFLEAQPEQARKMVKAHVRATEFIGQYPQEARQIAVKFTGMDEKTIALAMKHVHYTYAISVEGEKEFVEFLSRLKYIAVEDSRLFIQQFLNPQFLPEMPRK